LRIGHIAAAGAAALAISLASCGGGNSSTGNLRVALTDAQTCTDDYKSVFVTVDRVLVHRSATAAENSSGWEELEESTLPMRVDLMTLNNGAFQELGTMPLPAGTYQQVRLVLADNAGGPQYANQLTLVNDSSIALTTPSGQQSGLKLNVNMTIEAGQTSELILDFDPCQSVVKRGSSLQYNLKPVITAYFEEVNAIEGYTVPGSTVSAQQSGVIKKATVADQTGKFVLWPVEFGTYDIVITSVGHANAVLTGVHVVADSDGSPSTTIVSTEATRLTPPTSGMGVVAGDVTTTNPSPFDVSLSALQELTGGPTIEVAATQINVSASDPPANYDFTLASGNPVRAAWVAGTMSYTFTADDAITGDYTIRGQTTEFSPQELPADIGDGNDSVDFSFPAL
jgi:hypothetical protein